MFRVMDATQKHSEKQYFCDPFCYMRYIETSGRLVEYMKWRDIERFFRTLPNLYPEDDFYKHFRQYKYLARLDPEVTLEDVRKQNYPEDRKPLRKQNLGMQDHTHRREDHRQEVKEVE